MPETVKTEDCSRLREKIYSMIFPRWALVSVIGGILIVLAWLHHANASVVSLAANAQKKAELVEAVLTKDIEHMKESLGKIEAQQGEQRKLLQKIDRRLNGG